MSKEKEKKDMINTWYAASIVMYIRFKDGIQNKFPIWENVILIEAISEDEAFFKAEGYAKVRESRTDYSMTWEERPAAWVFGGIRQLVKISNSSEIYEVPGDGAEVTYSEMEVDDRESLEKFINGESVCVRFTEL